MRTIPNLDKENPLDKPLFYLSPCLGGLQRFALILVPSYLNQSSASKIKGSTNETFQKLNTFNLRLKTIHNKHSLLIKR